MRDKEWIELQEYLVEIGIEQADAEKIISLYEFDNNFKGLREAVYSIIQIAVNKVEIERISKEFNEMVNKIKNNEITT